jgi:hypothetical protein
MIVGINLHISSMEAGEGGASGIFELSFGG